MIYYELPIRIFSVGSSLFYTERKFKELAKKIGGDEFNEPKKENTQKKSKKGKMVYNVPEVKKRKKKRSEKLRISLCILFLIGIISVSFPFTKFNVERALDTEKDVAEYQCIYFPSPAIILICSPASSIPDTGPSYFTSMHLPVESRIITEKEHSGSD